uniref:RNase H type-1 domain-containing protein n=1 Tax=Leersia perrieri TaxID=77586 RepID=A0A0D9V1J8_9ORYZ
MSLVGLLGPIGGLPSLGFMVRNLLGEVLDAGAGHASCVGSALQAEALAVKYSLERVLGMTKIVVETDVINKALLSNNLDRIVIGGLYRHIRGPVRLAG